MKGRPRGRRSPPRGPPPPRALTFAGNDGNVLPSPHRSHLSSLSLGRPARLRPAAQEIPECPPPPNPIERLLSPEDKVQIIIGFISAGDVDLSKWAYSPSSCLSDISPAAAPPHHPQRLSSLPLSWRLAALLFLLLPDSGRFRSFRCLRPLFC